MYFGLGQACIHMYARQGVSCSFGLNGPHSQLRSKIEPEITNSQFFQVLSSAVCVSSGLEMGTNRVWLY